MNRDINNIIIYLIYSITSLSKYKCEFAQPQKHFILKKI